MVILGRRTTQKYPLSLQRGLNINNQRKSYRKTSPLKTDTLALSRRNNVSFGRGMTPAIRRAIKNTDVNAITAELTEKGIEGDFRGNKVLAWCCNEAVGVIEDLNKRFGCGFALPKGIFVRDFDDLDDLGVKPCFVAFVNQIPMKVDKSDRVYSPGSVFLNSHSSVAGTKKWYEPNRVTKGIDVIEDHFLEVIIHELMHVAHGSRLAERIGSDELRRVCFLVNNRYRRDFEAKYGHILAKTICSYAAKNPFDSIACDMAGRIVRSLDPKTLRPKYNPLEGTSYDDKVPINYHEKIDVPVWRRCCKFLSRLIPNEELTQRLLRRVWDGDFEFWLCKN